MVAGFFNWVVMMNLNLMLGDCLERAEEIPAGSVDLILTDLPYGTMKGAEKTNKYGKKDKPKHDWDSVIDTDKIMSIANRILRKNGKMVLFAQDPFSTELKNKALPNVPFNYSMIWEKDNFAFALIAKKAPVNYFEDILVFSKFSGIIEKSDYSKPHPLRQYFNEELLKSGKTIKDIIALVGCSASHYFTNGNQFRLPTREKYTLLQSTGFFTEDYNEIKLIHKEFRSERDTERSEYLQKHNERYPSTFNLWEGRKYKSNILKYKKDYSGHHPTQKPVLLLEDLIKTFSNANDLVVDLTMGSGSTGVACRNTNRKFIGIEMDENYFNIAKQRISDALS